VATGMSCRHTRSFFFSSLVFNFGRREGCHKVNKGGPSNESTRTRRVKARAKPRGRAMGALCMLLAMRNLTTRETSSHNSVTQNSAGEAPEASIWVVLARHFERCRNPPLCASWVARACDRSRRDEMTNHHRIAFGQVRPPPHRPKGRGGCCLGGSSRGEEEGERATKLGERGKNEEVGKIYEIKNAKHLWGPKGWMGPRTRRNATEAGKQGVRQCLSRLVCVGTSSVGGTVVVWESFLAPHWSRHPCRVVARC